MDDKINRLKEKLTKVFTEETINRDRLTKTIVINIEELITTLDENELMVMMRTIYEKGINNPGINISFSSRLDKGGNYDVTIDEDPKIQIFTSRNKSGVIYSLKLYPVSNKLVLGRLRTIGDTYTINPFYFDSSNSDKIEDILSKHAIYELDEIKEVTSEFLRIITGHLFEEITEKLLEV